jgi:hypothetical protein
MDPHFTSRFRAAIVARARFVEDLVTEQAGRGVGQYVILGAGLDTFAQRRPEIASRERPGREAAERGARASGRLSSASSRRWRGCAATTVGPVGNKLQIHERLEGGR